MFDENNMLMGDMKFGDAFAAAKKLDRDLVLRNDKVIPPVVKIMRYRNEILKKLFEKLGKDFEANQAASKKIKKPVAGAATPNTVPKDSKPKQLRLTTSISVHDLEYKKQQAHDQMDGNPG